VNCQQIVFPYIHYFLVHCDLMVENNMQYLNSQSNRLA